MSGETTSADEDRATLSAGGHPWALARDLAAAYALLIIYASLHPFSGWRDRGAPPLDFLYAAWPRYFTFFDLGINVAAYLPLGFLLVATLYRRLGRWGAPLAAVAAGVALSFSLELLQNYLPSRVPSNLDLASNSLGTLLGALLGARYGRAMRDGGSLHRLRERLLVRARSTNLGLVLLALWLLTQLNPEILLFGNGDLRTLLGVEAPFPFTAEGFQAVELGITAASVVAVGLIAWRLLRRPAPGPMVALFVLALLVRALAAAVLVGPEQSAHWITPGNLAGLASGAVLLFVAIALPRLLQQMVATLALLVATALANLAPENPYLAASLPLWSQGHFFNFNGLTRLTSSLWPFLAMAFLVACGPPRETAQ